MPEVESRDGAKSVEVVLTEFDHRKDQFSDLSKETVRLIETILREKSIAVQSIQGRVKSRDKLKSKYCKSEKDYKCLNDISDVVGFRIITYYSDKIDQIAEIIKREFAQIGLTDDKRTIKLETFGYSALHMDCAYSDKRLDSIEYKRFANARFEIQITTVIGHAWAEMHHAWYDSSDSPQEEERRFHRLAAVLELAEQEFLEIRTKKDVRERIASLQVAAESPEIPITSESLMAFIEQKDIVYKVDCDLAEIMGGTLRKGISAGQLSRTVQWVAGAGIGTVRELETTLTNAAIALHEFISRCAPIWRSSQSFSTSYPRGHCVSQLANLLISARGENEYISFLNSLGLSHDPSIEPGQVRIAEEIVRAHDLLQGKHS
jgi:ppGpp synthetase/RelA/SpoT-type nucleotidyltranferase